MPTKEDSSEYIRDYIQYKYDKMLVLLKQIKKLGSHIEKAEKIIEIRRDDV